MNEERESIILASWGTIPDEDHVAKWRPLFHTTIEILDWKLKFLRLNQAYLEDDARFLRESGFKSILEANFQLSFFDDHPLVRKFEERWGVPPGLADEKVGREFLEFGPRELSPVMQNMLPPLTGRMSPVKRLGWGPDAQPKEREHLLSLSIDPGFPMEMIVEFVLAHQREAQEIRYEKRRKRLPRRRPPVTGLGVELKTRIPVVIDLRASKKALGTEIRRMVRERIPDHPFPRFWGEFFERHQRSKLPVCYEITRCYVDPDCWAEKLEKLKSLDLESDRLASKLARKKLGPLSIAQLLSRLDQGMRCSRRRAEYLLDQGLRLALLKKGELKTESGSTLGQTGLDLDDLISARTESSSGCLNCGQPFPATRPPVTCPECSWPGPEHTTKLGKALSDVCADEAEAMLARIRDDHPEVAAMIQLAINDPDRLEEVSQHPDVRGLLGEGE